MHLYGNKQENFLSGQGTRSLVKNPILRPPAKDRAKFPVSSKLTMITLRFVITLSLSLLASLALHWFVRKELPESYAHQLSYNEIYLDSTNLRISNVKNNDTTLFIELRGLLEGMTTNLPSDYFVNASTLRFTGHDSGERYWIRQKSRIDSVNISVNYTSGKKYLEAGNSSRGNFEINTSSLPFSEADLVSHHSWAFDFGYSREPETEQVWLREYLQDTIKIHPDDATPVKLQKIYAHLWPLVQPALGVPADSLTGQPASRIILLLKSGDIKVWCGNLSSLLGALTHAAGIDTRLVTTEGYQSFSFPVHSFNEVYFPEFGVWVYTDLTHGIPYLMGNNGPINTVQLNRLFRSALGQADIEKLISVNADGPDSTVRVPETFKSYFAPPQRFRYYHPEYLGGQNDRGLLKKIKSILRPTYNFSYYSDDIHHVPWPYWLRFITGYLAILLAISLFAAVMIKWWKVRRLPVFSGKRI